MGDIVFADDHILFHGSKIAFNDARCCCICSWCSDGKGPPSFELNIGDYTNLGCTSCTGWNSGTVPVILERPGSQLGIFGCAASTGTAVSGRKMCQWEYLQNKCAGGQIVYAQLCHMSTTVDPVTPYWLTVAQAFAHQDAPGGIAQCFRKKYSVPPNCLEFNEEEIPWVGSSTGVEGICGTTGMMSCSLTALP